LTLKRKQGHVVIINVYTYALITQVDANLTSKLLRVQEGHIFAYILRTFLWAIRSLLSLTS
jgi:hypothetical protein